MFRQEWWELAISLKGVCTAIRRVPLRLSQNIEKFDTAEEPAKKSNFEKTQRILPS
jgi:hypothetical protein